MSLTYLLTYLELYCLLCNSKKRPNICYHAYWTNSL